MSKLINDLNKFSKLRRMNAETAVDDRQKAPAKAPAAGRSHSVYLIGLFLIVLFVFNALSMAVSFRGLSRLQETEGTLALVSEKILERLDGDDETSTLLLQALNKHGNKVQALETLITDKNSEETVRMTELQDQIRELKIAIEVKERTLSDITIAQNSIKTSIENSIGDLKIANKLMLEKYISLNDKVKKLSETNPIIPNTY